MRAVARTMFTTPIGHTDEGREAIQKWGCEQCSDGHAHAKYICGILDAINGVIFCLMACASLCTTKKRLPIHTDASSQSEK